MTLALAIGLICAMALCAVRVFAEARNTDVAVVMTAADMAVIDGDIPGVTAFTPGETLPGLNLWLSDGQAYSEKGAVVGIVEDLNQYSFVPIEGFAPDADTAMVRVFRLFPDFSARYGALGYEGAEEIENILYRAVTDRNIRVIWLEPFVNSQTGEVITDAGTYNEVLSSLAERIATHGLKLGEGFSVFPAYAPNPALITGCLLGLIAAGALLLRSFFTLRPFWENALLIALLVIGAAAYVLRPALAIQLFALAAAVIFPCLALFYMAAALEESTKSLKRGVAPFAGILIKSVGIAFSGGILISALQSGTFYLLAIDNFRGVKVSQALPLLFAVYIVFRRMYGGEGLREIVSGKKFMLALAIIAVIAAAGYYVLRTGDGAINVSVIEQRFRNWLEHVLIARPRTKEFLISWPCMAISYALIARGARKYAWPFAIMAAPGLASVVNTFCHSRAPFWLSTVRTALGLLIGLIIGLVLAYILTPKKKA